MPTIFTIGHSNHPIETFLDLLARAGIEALIDVRSQPYSRYSRHFDQGRLKQIAARVGIRYAFLGRELGGRPEGDEFYDSEGYVLYDRVARAAFFRRGIDLLERALQRHRMALLCGEEDPSGCHRRLLVARVLAARGVEIEHIRGDGRIQPEAVLRAEEDQRKAGSGQLALFQLEKEPEWRSIRSVLRRRAPPDSSEP